MPWERDPAQYVPAPLLLSSPKYPNFKPANLPWYDAPKAVTDVINMGFENTKTLDGSAYKMPFVCVRVNSSGVDVYAGVNVLLGVSSTFTVRPISPVPHFSSMSTSYCYYARFGHDYKVKSNWQLCNTYAWSDSVAYCSQTYISTDYNIDVYVYGGNGIRNTETLNPFVGSIEFQGRKAYVNNVVGFESGQILVGTATGEYPNVYLATFKPPTYEDQEKQKDKNLLDSITSIPEKIKGFFDNLFEKIKGLFVPSEGFFDEYIGEYSIYFEESLGILYELPETVVDILSVFMYFNPNKTGYGIDIPEVTLPIKQENGAMLNFTIFEAQFYEFDFLNNGAFATLYQFYRSFVWVVLLLCLISFALKKFNQITGG